MMDELSRRHVIGELEHDGGQVLATADYIMVSPSTDMFPSGFEGEEMLASPSVAGGTSRQRRSTSHFDGRNGAKAERDLRQAVGMTR